MSSSWHGVRRIQVIYALTLALSVIATFAAVLIKRFNDINFDENRETQLRLLVKVSQSWLYTNAILVLGSFALLIRDLLRPTSVPVWAELTWSFVFGVVEVINIVLSAMAYPTLHCSPSSDSAAQLIRRENPDGAVLGQYSDDNLLDTASGEICTNWSVAFVFFSMLMMILFIQVGWLVLLGLRHRSSHPNFWGSEVPLPYTWHLKESKPSRPADVESITSFNSIDCIKEASHEKADLQQPSLVYSGQQGVPQ